MNNKVEAGATFAGGVLGGGVGVSAAILRAHESVMRGSLSQEDSALLVADFGFLSAIVGMGFGYFIGLVASSLLSRKS